jgi:putative ABC transport system substrate-binding protein
MACDPAVRLGRRRVLQGGLATMGLALLSGCGMPALPGAQTTRVFLLGLFHVGLDHVPPSLDGLRDGLKALGYDVGSAPAPLVSTVMEGTNIRLDWRNLPDEATALETAKTFVRDRVDLIVAFESQSVRAAKAATADIPVLFLHVTDPVGEGFAKSLADPGGNLTGFGEFFADVLAKRMEVFKELVPQLGSLLVLIDPQDRAMPQQLAEVRKAATTLKLQLVEREVTRQIDVERVFDSLQPGEVQGVFVASSSLVTKFPSLILRLAAERHLPVPGHRREWAEEGALFSYGANFRAVGQDAATYVDKILKGARPTDLPVQQVTRLELVINLKTAGALDVTIPQSVLQQATQVLP